jgi:hypothetical protein
MLHGLTNDWIRKVFWMADVKNVIINIYFRLFNKCMYLITMLNVQMIINYFLYDYDVYRTRKVWSSHGSLCTSWRTRCKIQLEKQLVIRCYIVRILFIFSFRHNTIVTRTKYTFDDFDSEGKSPVTYLVYVHAGIIQYVMYNTKVVKRCDQHKIISDKCKVSTVRVQRGFNLRIEPLQQDLSLLIPPPPPRCIDVTAEIRKAFCGDQTNKKCKHTIYHSRTTRVI